MRTLFQLFWRPEVMMLLMLIAIYGIIAEMSHPGAIFPGVAGAIALILLLYMSATLPVNVTGVALIDWSGRRAVHHGHFCADARRVDRRRHRRLFPRRADAVQSRADRALAFADDLDHSGHAGHGGVFCVRCRQGNSRAVQPGPRRQGNHARPDGQRAFPD